MAGDEQFLSWDLADVVAGKPPRDDAWQGPSGLAALQSGEGSINMPMFRQAIKLRAGNAAERTEAIATWKDLFQFFQGQWMGSELGSRIYGVWHMLAVASVLDWAEKNGQPDLAKLAQGWLLHWWCLLKLVEAPDGRLLMVGMRSGGHEPNPGFLEWTWALATDGPVDRWEAVAKELNLGLRQNWIYSAAISLKEVLRASAAPIRQGGDPVALIPHYGLVEPYHVLKTEGGLAVWIEHNQNGNTTPVAGAVWTPQSLDWLPKDGGNRIRQKFEQIDCRPQGGLLVYDSNFQGHQEIPLPPGKVLAQVTLPLGTPNPVVQPGTGQGETPATPVLPPADTGTQPDTTLPPTPPDTPAQPPEPPIPPMPPMPPMPPVATRTPQAISDDVMTLAVPKKQQPLRRRIAEELAALPAGRTPAEIAADLATLGISQGQLDLWQRLQREVLALGQAAPTPTAPTTPPESQPPGPPGHPEPGPKAK
jgi:hypothetical protein